MRHILSHYGGNRHFRSKKKQEGFRLSGSGPGSQQKAISRIETGSRLVTDYELKYLAEVLNIPVRLLLEEEDSETTDPETVTAENFISAFQAGRFGESPTAHHPDKIIIDVTIRCLSDPPEKDK